ncbi:spermatogenesis-associated protein 7 isoform X3 [Nannospalax galili]|uniref:spermatogenesis-associated protein 7 isoform X3 n=1 Tax=Nannospalax galili TaxID=1026970 RepID=UPI0004ED2B8F|nr:spermatogenesis-associated protein 7 isoform X3 [Nannospalax galili]
MLQKDGWQPERYSPSCLFTGHLSTKSNAFCTDSSSLRLTTLQLVKNHMAVHYNKILSAKAAVDCSVPVSMNTSIKYADQQRREKLKKELAQYEKEFKLNKSVMQGNSKMNSKSLFRSLQKPSGEPKNQDVLIEVNRFPSFSKSLISSSNGLYVSQPKADNIVMNSIENSSASPSIIDYAASGPRNLSSGPGCDRKPKSSYPSTHRFQLVISKASSGDLLEKHSDLFSNKQLPFTPRTLKTEAKSFLSQYRYYTPARRKKNFPDQQIDAETQTELSSFHSNFWAAETKNLTDSDMNTEQRSNCMTNGTEIRVSPLPLEGLNLPQDKIKDRALQQSSQRILYEFSTQLSSDNKIYSDEEDLLYLNFIQDVTDEILKLGLFSNRFLERLFERHIKQNKHHLEEEKMRRLLHGLKVDLGCTSEENPAKQNNDRMSNLPDFQKALNSNQSELNSILQLECQQYQEALDMSSMPKDDKMFSLPGEFLRSSHKHKCSEDVTVNQVNDETDLEVSTWDENNPGISNSLMDQETSVDIVECDSDTKKLEASRELCCLSTSPSLQYPSIKGGINHGKELSTLRIMEMSTEG